MKKLAIILLIIALPIIIFFQYKQYERFHPPVNYTYPVNDSIDINYHDQLLVSKYYEQAFKVGAIARESWFNEDIDVRFPDLENIDARERAALYNQIIASVKHIEKILIQSKMLKAQGFNNEEIKTIEKEGISPKKFRYKKYLLDKMIGAKKGDKNSGVWEVQKLLNTKGYKIPTDGIFDIRTDSAIRDFQTKNNLYPSGIAEEDVLDVLID
ncbi:peptidoglycan-binding domain-containing protein [Flexithrix dorotheae]|uniref:peptidoglycan-binding domain-containing protein n=1 Tax=Flexithrix dorotheae TaxID=70993 RepID=UPI0003791315|nr:peptidoglycan-binding domain-containing protein [Flexithrix dorotheae]